MGKNIHTKNWRAVRTKTGVLLLCVSALVYSVEILRRTHVLTKVPADLVTLNETRLAQLKKRLPSSGVVGYVSDDINIDESIAGRRFALTQYALTPVILERTTDHDLVVGVFKDPSVISSLAVSRKLVIVEEFGEGVVLFKKK